MKQKKRFGRQSKSIYSLEMTCSFLFEFVCPTTNTAFEENNQLK